MGYKDLPDPNKKNLWRTFRDKWNKSLQKDKQLHFGLGSMCGITGVVMSALGWISILEGIFLIHIVGYGLELYQSTTKDRFVEANDAYATVAGGMMPYVCLHVFNVTIRIIEMVS